MAEANRAETIRQIFAANLANDREFVENALPHGAAEQYLKNNFH
jgi:hypothetical protein